MKHLVQYTEKELNRLIREDLSAKGHKIIPSDVMIEFVTGSSGTSALVTGVLLEESVQEPVPEEGDEVVRMVAHDTVRVALSKKGLTVDGLVELVMEELEESDACQELDEDETVKKAHVYVLELLQKLEKEGVALYEDSKGLWCKRAKRKVPKKLSTAAEILGGDGGVLDRSDALGEGVSEENPRAPKKRPGASGPKRRKAQGARGRRGNGSPFTF